MNLCAVSGRNRSEQGWVSVKPARGSYQISRHGKIHSAVVFAKAGYLGQFYGKFCGGAISSTVIPSSMPLRDIDDMADRVAIVGQQFLDRSRTDTRLDVAWVKKFRLKRHEDIHSVRPGTNIPVGRSSHDVGVGE